MKSNYSFYPVVLWIAGIYKGNNLATSFIRKQWPSEEIESETFSSVLAYDTLCSFHVYGCQVYASARLNPILKFLYCVHHG